MGYFPFYTDVAKLHGVIIGGGSVALEKVVKLLAFDANLTLVAKEVCDEIMEYKEKIEIIVSEYSDGFLDNADYVICATDNRVVNEQVWQDVKSRKLLINVVDVPEKCDFIFPSVLKRGRLVVGVSTSGAGPRVAIKLKDEIAKTVPENIEEILDYLAEERIKAKERIPDPKERRKYLIELADRLLDYEK